MPPGVAISRFTPHGIHPACAASGPITLPAAGEDKAGNVEKAPPKLTVFLKE
jgi:hypothetical protein